MLLNVSQFFKDNRTVRIFAVFEKFTSAYLNQIAQEIYCCYLLIIYMKNTSQIVKTDEILVAPMCYLHCALVLQLCIQITTLHLRYMKNACNFFNVHY